MIRLMIILGSTREGRFGEKIADWVIEQVTLLKDFKVDFVDLRDIELPFFAEALPPAAIKDGNYSNPQALAWSQRVKEADAFLIITLEYNHSYPAVLKNALDYVYYEWNNKPAAFVGYGVVGAVRAIEHLRGVVAQLQMVSVQEAVHMNIFPSPFDEDQEMTEEHYNHKLTSVFKQLLWWAQALKLARLESSSPRPAVSQRVVSSN
ncbi:MAG: NAD(P)H-dependent oxidoreductase [Patescibacteria group bacterium]